MPAREWVPELPAQGGAKFGLLVQEIRGAVRSGVLPAGARMPAVRDLAWRLGVTPGTVARAYQIAAREGLIDSHVGRGSFVRAAPAATPSLQPLLTERDGRAGLPDGPVDLRLPQLPDVGQVEALRAAMAAAAGGLDDRLLRYPGPDEDAPCRAAMLAHLAERPLGPVDPDDLVLTLGGQNGLALALLLLTQSALARPVILAEALGYPGLRRVATMTRAALWPMAMDREGVRPEALDAAARDSGARIVCLTPSAHSPTASTMSLARREAIAAVARRRDLQIIEDDCLCPTPLPDAPPATATLRALVPERVWHVSSLSKTISPALRAGALICPPGAGRAGRLAAQHLMFGLPATLTGVIEHLARAGDLARLAGRVAAVHADRVALAVETLAGVDLGWQPGLPFMWLRLPPGWTSAGFAAQAGARGVLLRTEDDFALAETRRALAGGTLAGGALAGGGLGADAPSPCERRQDGRAHDGQEEEGRRQGVRIALDCQAPRARLAEGLRLLRDLHDRPCDRLVI